MPGSAPDWLWLVIAAWYVVWNLVAAGVFVWDKRSARHGGRRVPERRLLWLVWLGGFVGAWAAMRSVRHKTTRLAFRLTPLAAGVLHGGPWLLVLLRPGA